LLTSTQTTEKYRCRSVYEACGLRTFRETSDS
jgi:hypothetical protein